MLGEEKHTVHLLNTMEYHLKKCLSAQFVWVTMIRALVHEYLQNPEHCELPLTEAQTYMQQVDP